MVIVRHVPKDKLERLVQASCSVRVVQGQPIHIHDPGQGPLSFMILTAALDFFPRRQELAVFLSSSDLSHLSQEPWGEGPGQDRFLQQSVPGLGLQMPFSFEGDVLDGTASLAH